MLLLNTFNFSIIGVFVSKHNNEACYLNDKQALLRFLLVIFIIVAFVVVGNAVIIILWTPFKERKHVLPLSYSNLGSNFRFLWSP